MEPSRPQAVGKLFAAYKQFLAIAVHRFHVGCVLCTAIDKIVLKPRRTLNFELWLCPRPPPPGPAAQPGAAAGRRPEFSSAPSLYRSPAAATQWVPRPYRIRQDPLLDCCHPG